MKTRSYRIPPITVLLGSALDLVTESRGRRTKFDLGDGWQVLTDADAIERSPGRARLYLVRAPLSEKVPNLLNRSSAIRTWQVWHERERPELIGGLYDLPDSIGEPIGRAVMIGYRSDKYNRAKRWVDYQHDFREGKPPLVYVDQQTEPRAIVLTGGSMAITGRGIE